MRGAARVIACTWILVLGTATPSEAIWRWLEKMSGPGPYAGLFFDFKIRCKYSDTPTPQEVVELQRQELERLRMQLERLKKLLADLAAKEQVRKGELVEEIERIDAQVVQLEQHLVSGGMSFPCAPHNRTGDVRRPRDMSYGVTGGLLWTTANRLEFAPSVSEADKRVWAVTAGGFADWRILRRWVDRIEAGVASELYVFFGKAMTGADWNVSLEPRATITLATVRTKSGMPWLHFKTRAGVAFMLREMTTEDFGALPGTKLGPEMLTSIRFLADFECFPFKSGSCGKSP